MLTVGSSAMVTARISMFRISAAPHLWGFFVLHPPVTFSPRKCSRCPEKTGYLLHFAPKNVADTTLRQRTQDKNNIEITDNIYRYELFIYIRIGV